MVDELENELAVMKAERGGLAVSDAGRMVTASFGDILPVATMVIDGLAGA
jgi:hypothetical protein